MTAKLGNLPDELRCTAKAKATKERCKNTRVGGTLGTTCRLHGGSTKRNRDAVRDRLAAEAEKAVETIVELRDADATTPDPAPHAVRLNAAKALLDRAGYSVTAKLDVTDRAAALLDRMAGVLDAEVLDEDDDVVEVEVIEALPPGVFVKLDYGTAAALVHRLHAMDDDDRDHFVKGLATDELDLIEQALATIEAEKPAVRFPSPDTLGRHVEEDRWFTGGIGTVISDVISEAVRDVEAGHNRRIVVTAPPRAGKSFLTSVFSPAWVLHRHPDWSVILASAEASLATAWARKVRRLVVDIPELNVQLAEDSRAAGEWETTKGGGMIARGIRGQLTGRGGRVALIDDPFRSLADVASKAQRDAVWDWWTAVLLPRMEAPSLVVVVATRWHVDDLTGRILSSDYDGDPDDWTVIDAPAIAVEPSPAFPYDDALSREPGTPLPSPFASGDLTAFWDDLRRAVGRNVWTSLYQGRPAPIEGDVFRIDDLNIGTEPPATGSDVISVDLTFGSENGDYAVAQVWRRSGPDFFLLDQARGRYSFTEQLGQLRHLAAKYPHASVVIEKAANGAAAIEVLQRELPAVIPIKPTKGKLERAMAVTPMVEAGNVHLPAHVPWLDDFLSEVRDFPRASHDDVVDSMTQALTFLRGRTGAAAHVPKGDRSSAARGSLKTTRRARTIPTRYS